MKHVSVITYVIVHVLIWTHVFTVTGDCAMNKSINLCLFKQHIELYLLIKYKILNIKY